MWKRAVILTVLLCCSVSGLGQETKPAVRVPRPGVRPVPAEVEVVDVRRGLKAKYQKDYAEVTQVAKRRLALLMMREAGNAAGDAALYVTLSEARELAVGAGEVELALQAAGDQGRQFDMDAEALRVVTMQACEKVKLSPLQAGVLARAARGLAESRLAADDFEGAVRAANIADASARKGGDIALQSELAMLVDFCKEVQRLSPGFRTAVRTLEELPDDARANQTAGEFLVLVKQEWGRALVMLSRGADPALKKAATLELSAVRGAELVPAADAWAAWADKRQGPGRAIAQRHALQLYQRSVDGLEGAQLELTLERVAGLCSSMPGGELADRRAARAELGEARWEWFESLRLGGIEMRPDTASIQTFQGQLSWNPRLDEEGEVPPLPGTDGSESAKKPLTYTFRILCVDERGERKILEGTGKLTWRSTAKPISVPGPKNTVVRRANGNKLTPAGMHVIVRLDGVIVAERVWRLPAKRAWWLEESLVAGK